MVFCFLMLTRPPISTRTTTRLPYTTLFRSAVRYAAVSARYKVYIIDEVHMLSKSAFNALLKTLEEPPAHVKLLFATTEIQKVPVTVLSRSQRFDLKRIPAERLAEHFAGIIAQEGVRAEA